MTICQKVVFIRTLTRSILSCFYIFSRLYHPLRLGKVKGSTDRYTWLLVNSQKYRWHATPLPPWYCNKSFLELLATNNNRKKTSKINVEEKKYQPLKTYQKNTKSILPQGAVKSVAHDLAIPVTEWNVVC